jgi:hypothetical protein
MRSTTTEEVAAVQAQGRPHPRLGTRDLDAREGDVVKGTVVRKIKGGLLVDIGVPVFLPASQVDAPPPGDIGDFIGKRDRAQDHQDRRRAHEHRRLAPQADRRAARRSAPKRLSTLKEGEIRKARSRTSPTSARSSTSAASTACCTSPTCRGAASTTRANCSRSTRRSRSRSSTSTASGEDRARPQAAAGFAVGRDREEVPGRLAARRRSRQPHAVRRVREARGRHRRPRPHLRDVVDAPRQPSVEMVQPSDARSR